MERTCTVASFYTKAVIHASYQSFNTSCSGTWRVPSGPKPWKHIFHRHPQSPVPRPSSTDSVRFLLTKKTHVLRYTQSAPQFVPCAEGPIFAKRAPANQSVQSPLPARTHSAIESTYQLCGPGVTGSDSAGATGGAATVLLNRMTINIKSCEESAAAWKEGRMNLDNLPLCVPLSCYASARLSSSATPLFVQKCESRGPALRSTSQRKDGCCGVPALFG